MFDFVLGEALVTLFFVETTPAMHKHEYKHHVKTASHRCLNIDVVGANKSGMSGLGCGALLVDVQMTQ